LLFNAFLVLPELLQTRPAPTPPIHCGAIGPGIENEGREEREREREPSRAARVRVSHADARVPCDVTAVARSSRGACPRRAGEREGEGRGREGEGEGHIAARFRAFFRRLVTTSAGLEFNLSSAEAESRWRRGEGRERERERERKRRFLRKADPARRVPGRVASK